MTEALVTSHEELWPEDEHTTDSTAASSAGLVESQEYDELLSRDTLLVGDYTIDRPHGPAPQISSRMPEDERGPVLAAAERMPGDDIFRLYLREIGKIPLLNAAQEVELAKRIEAGLYAGRLILELEAKGREVSTGVVRIYEEREEDEPEVQPPSLEELIELEADGARAKNHMIEANLRLVVSVAKRYKGSGLPVIDLVQEGSAGLIRAVEKFDYARGYKFSTYATWWIRQGITRAIADQARTIRIPVHAVEEINKIRRTRRDMLAHLDRDPTDAEVGQKLDMDVERIQWLDLMGGTLASLNKPIGDDGGGPGEKETTLEDLIEDDTETDRPQVLVSYTLLGEAVEDHLTRLNEREADVIRWRYGLGSNEEHTLEQIGRRLGITRERVRQIENKAMDKLRKHAALSGLHDFLSY